GVGKTTVATGLMAALRRRGDRVAPAKVGPDFIDPGYHALATGRPGRNLDAWICGEDRIAPLAAKAASGADVLVVEGVMGLFDGAAEPDSPASTAHVARLLDAPVVLVVDASAMSGSVAALVHGYTTFDESVRVAGVVLNRVGSAAHESMLREALAPLGIPVLGALARADDLAWRDRHLGLVPVVEQRADTALPAEADAVYAGGGFPEVFVEELAANHPLLTDVRDRMAAGVVAWAECGGLLWLSRSLDGHALCGVLDAEGSMSERLTLGYRRAHAGVDTPLAPAGTELRGHEFHYSSLEPAGDALTMSGRNGET